MKKLIALLIALLCLAVFPAWAEEAPVQADIAMLDGLYFVEVGYSESGSMEYYQSEDGLVGLCVMTLLGIEYPQLTEELGEDGVVVDCATQDVYPIQRIRYEAGQNEDAIVTDTTAIWLEDASLVYIFTVDSDAWYGFAGDYEAGEVQAALDLFVAELQQTLLEEGVVFEANDYGLYTTYLETEFFLVGIPDEWEGLYVCEIVPAEPFGYTVIFSDKTDGFVFSLEARWHDGETVQLESVWQGYLGRLEVERLGELDLLVTYSQYAPDAGEAWQLMYDACREVVDTLLLQEGVMLDMGEYLEYEP